MEITNLTCRRDKKVRARGSGSLRFQGLTGNRLGTICDDANSVETKGRRFLAAARVAILRRRFGTKS